MLEATLQWKKISIFYALQIIILSNEETTSAIQSKGNQYYNFQAVNEDGQSAYAYSYSNPNNQMTSSYSKYVPDSMNNGQDYKKYYQN